MYYSRSNFQTLNLYPRDQHLMPNKLSFIKCSIILKIWWRDPRSKPRQNLIIYVWSQLLFERTWIQITLTCLHKFLVLEMLFCILRQSHQQAANLFRCNQLISLCKCHCEVIRGSEQVTWCMRKAKRTPCRSSSSSFANGSDFSVFTMRFMYSFASFNEAFFSCLM